MDLFGEQQELLESEEKAGHVREGVDRCVERLHCLEVTLVLEVENGGLWDLDLDAGFRNRHHGKGFIAA